MPSQKIETGHQDTVHDVAMDFYGKRIATASSDSTIKIVGVSNNTHQHLATLTGHQGPVWQVAWAHPKFGSLLASCCYDGRVIIWKEGNQNEWAQAHVFDDHKSSVNSIAWAPHELGLCLACGSSDGNISVFTARADGGWDVSRIDQAHPVGVTSVSWAPSTAPGALVGSGLLDPVQKLCSGGCDNTVKVWKLYNGIWKMDCFPALQMHTDWVRDVAWAPNLGLPKSTIASASQDGKVIIWTVAKEGDQWEGKVLHDFGTPVWRVSWSLTGNILAVADGNNNVTLWKEAVDGEWQQCVELVRPLRQLSFMSDLDIQIPTAFDPFADANAEDSGAGTKEYVHIRIQQRNGRKSLTTVQGLKKEFSYNKILKDLKKEFCCNGTVVQDPELGQVIQLQGDQRKNVSTFLVQAGIVKKDNIKIHGF
ncbi:protein transport protein SEC13-like protein B [Gossypium australe]|uniref:Protein transport protein SEC13-like protein B n=3 Tax=Gossypium TaxID=3633 RepID=A0A5B6VTN5_9ROSI|nr:protein transport protein SEC13-like protein B [Gossypium australe]